MKFFILMQLIIMYIFNIHKVKNSFFNTKYLFNEAVERYDSPFGHGIANLETNIIFELN